MLHLAILHFELINQATLKPVGRVLPRFCDKVELELAAAHSRADHRAEPLMSIVQSRTRGDNVLGAILNSSSEKTRQHLGGKTQLEGKEGLKAQQRQAMAWHINESNI